MEDCIFCKIIDKEIPSQLVYEDDNIIAFNDINPQAPIHVLIVPKKHIDSLISIKEEDYKLIYEIYRIINILAEKLEIDTQGFRIITNCGEAAGQTVKHLHFHLLAGQKLGEKII